MAQKSPAEIVQDFHNGLKLLVANKNDPHKFQKNQVDVNKTLMCMKNILFDTDNPEMISEMTQEIFNYDSLIAFVEDLELFNNEGKTIAGEVFKKVVSMKIGLRVPAVEYFLTHESTLHQLVQRYDNPDTALISGTMLRECINYTELAQSLLVSEYFFLFFDYILLSAPEVSSDAFETFKVLLTRHEMLCGEFLERKYDEVFEHYRKLLNSNNNVIKQQALKLLSELLWNRHNFTTMMRFTSNTENLELIMTALREESRGIQFEAFNVFKIFVANPNKSPPVLKILLQNQMELIDFLTTFQTDRSDDERFNDEKSFTIMQLKELMPLDA